MTFNEAGHKVIPFGPYRGKNIATIAQTDKGLLYLDRLMEWPPLEKFEDIYEALTIFLSDQAIKDDLKRILGND